MAHLTFLHFAKPVHAQSESPRVAVKASKERGERGDCISRPSLYHFPRASFGTSDRKVERHTKCALHRRLHDCTCRPRRARFLPPARQPAINMPELAEIAASRGHRERGGARPAGASQSRIPSSSIPRSVCWGWRMNFLPWRLFFLRTLLPLLFLRSDRPADSISGPPSFNGCAVANRRANI